MKKFEWDYDKKYDDFFIFEKGRKSDGSVEFGHLILDFTNSGRLVGVEIMNASKIIPKNTKVRGVLTIK